MTERKRTVAEGKHGMTERKRTMTGIRERAVRWGILGAAVLMMAVGILNGETRTVLGKAVNICLECIGIG